MSNQIDVNAVGEAIACGMKTKTGMIREEKDNKLNFLSYFTTAGLTRYAKHMKIGEIKHGRSNWKLGSYPKEEYLESAMRHLMLVSDGDVSEDHISAIIFNCFGYMHEEHVEDNGMV